MLLDAGYDNEENHFLLREQLRCISQICPNRRRLKKTYFKKFTKKYKELLYQTTLNRYIPKAKRKKKYHKCCLVLRDDKEYKRFYRMRITSEQQFTILKRDLFLESHGLMGLEKLQKHVALKCLCMLVIALAILRMGFPEDIRAPKYFQQ